MRPFPDTFSDLPSGCHRDRPWWLAGTEYGDGWTRSDGWQVTDNGYRYYSSAPIDLDLDQTPEGNSYEEVMAAIDREWPLAAPSLRAGQVWLLVARNGWTMAALDNIIHKFLHGGVYRSGSTDPAWNLGGELLTHSEAEALLLRSAHDLVNAYLIADPVDPEFSYWTGAK